MKEKNIIFSTDDFKTKVIPLITEGLTVPLVVTGSSMTPYIVPGRDTVYISKPSFPLKKGDLAFFERLDGRVVMHRIYKAKNNSYWFVGDAQTEIEGPVCEKQIFGQINMIYRKGKAESRFSPIRFFFRYIWIRMIPLRPHIIKLFTKFRAIKKSDGK